MTSVESSAPPARQPTFDGARAFEAMSTAFERNVARKPSAVRESFFSLGGAPVRMRVVGRDLARHIAAPFEHLTIDASSATAPALTIDLWDGTETEAHRPPGGPDARWTQVRATSSDGRFVAQRLPNTLTCFDRHTARIVGRVAWSEEIFIYERGKPFTAALVPWLGDRGIHVAHAGLVALDERGVLVAGRSGAGKSTVALAALGGGFRYFGEDYVGVQPLEDGSFLGHSLYGSIFLDADHLRRFAWLSPHVIHGRTAAEEKSLLLLSPLFPGRLGCSVPIRLMVLPRVTDREASRTRPASRAEALLALAPSSLVTIPGSRPAALAALGGLVEDIPCYWVELGRDVDSIAPRLQELVREVATT